jgi:DNA mismatch endonuclease, patch repair protein
VPLYSKRRLPSRPDGGPHETKAATRGMDKHLDHLTKENRSALMRKVRSSGTTPEMIVRTQARLIRKHFQINSKRLPGSPDLAFFRIKRAVFVHGCFWHQHSKSSCKRSNIPKSNIKYWLPKLRRNVRRDSATKCALSRMGWKAMTIWECDCADVLRIKAKLERFLYA